MSIEGNRFDTFFASNRYASLKNFLYNYRIRMKAVNKALNEDRVNGPILEVGSGISPLLMSNGETVQSDLSVNAMSMMKAKNPRCKAVAANIQQLPFKSGSFAYVICSEVLEHVEKDDLAIKELGRVLRKGGKLILTFPHRQMYFSNDDSYVGHYRRYELDSILSMLSGASLNTMKIQKVLGPCEKLTMSFLVFCLQTAERFGRGSISRTRLYGRAFTIFFDLINQIYSYLMRFDAFLFPRSISTVLLVKAEKL